MQTAILISDNPELNKEPVKILDKDYTPTQSLVMLVEHPVVFLWPKNKLKTGDSETTPDTLVSF